MLAQQGLFNGATASAGQNVASICQISNANTEAAAVVHFNFQIENFNVASSGKGLNADSMFRVGGSIAKATFGNAINLTPAMNAIRMRGSAGTMTGQFSVEGWRG